MAPYAYAYTHTHKLFWASYQQHKQICKKRQMDIHKKRHKLWRQMVIFSLMDHPIWTKTDTQTNIRHIGICNVCKHIYSNLNIIYTEYIQTHCRVQFECQNNICTNTYSHIHREKKQIHWKSPLTPSTQTVLEQAEFGRKRGFKTRSKQSSK